MSELITHFTEVAVQTNHGYYLLKDASWDVYPPASSLYNAKGDNGTLTGTVVKGQTTSRLFHCTSTTHATPGEVKTFEYASQTKLRQPAGETPYFDLTFCG